VRRLRPWILLLVAGATALALACGDDSSSHVEKIVQAPPWTGEEHLFYRLTQKGVNGNATCELQTMPGSGADQPLTLARLCQQDEHHDDATATVDMKTLRPLKTMRTYQDTKQGKRTTYTNDYHDGAVHFELNTDGKVRATDRDLPRPTADSPDPGWYDDDETLWLVRAIQLTPGYSATFRYVINAGQPRLLDTDVKVDRTETVHVPAGDIETVRVRFIQGDVVWVYWVERAAPHRVVKAMIEDSTYELTRSE
jgi:hypothetical protein